MRISISDLAIGMAEKLRTTMPVLGVDVESETVPSVPGEVPAPAAAPQSHTFTSYRKKKAKSTGAGAADTLRKQIERYLEIDSADFEEKNGMINPFSFWAKQEHSMLLIARVAAHVLTIPATSAPVERVFSHSWLIARPHRATISDTNLSHIIFLKCNRL